MIVLDVMKAVMMIFVTSPSNQTLRVKSIKISLVIWFIR